MGPAGAKAPQLSPLSCFVCPGSTCSKEPPEPTLRWLPSSVSQPLPIPEPPAHHRQRTNQPPHTILPPGRTPEASAEPRTTLLPTATATGWNTIDVPRFFFLIKGTISLNASLFNNNIIIISVASGRVWLNWRTGEFMVFQHHSPEQLLGAEGGSVFLQSPGWEDPGRYPEISGYYISHLKI